MPEELNEFQRGYIQGQCDSQEELDEFKKEYEKLKDFLNKNRQDWVDEVMELTEPAFRLRERAITNACYCLDPNQGETPDPVMAYKWLRTTYPHTHPNYVDPKTLPTGFEKVVPSA